MLHWLHRPFNLQLQIDYAWNNIKDNETSAWGRYNGDTSYELCHINEYLLLKAIIRQDSQRKQFFVLDLGAGNFQFAKALSQSINNDSDLSPDVNIQIISVRGEQSVIPTYQQIGCCHLHFLGHVQIEYLIHELQAYGSNLTEQIDLITSRWTLRHLADPVGVFMQTYLLLRPKTGLMLFDEFYFLINPTMEDWYQFENVFYLLLESKLSFLMFQTQKPSQTNQFIIKKTEHSSLRLDWSYEGIELIAPRYDIAALTLTRFSVETSTVHSREITTQICEHSTDCLWGDPLLHHELTQQLCLDSKIPFKSLTGFGLFSTACLTTSVPHEVFHVHQSPQK